MAVHQCEVTQLGCRVPRVQINLKDPDYVQKSENPDNYLPAVLVKVSGGVTAVVVTKEEALTLKKGDVITVETSDYGYWVGTV